MTYLQHGRRSSVGLTLALMVMVIQLGSAPAAEARCDGVNREVTSTLGAGSIFVAERPVAGSCNNNNLYQATLRRVNTYQAEAVAVYTQNGGVWSQVAYTNSTSGAPYAYRDNNSNSFMTLCWFDYRRVAHCGWGSAYGPVGTTPRSDPDLYNRPGYHGVNFGF